MKSTRLGLTLIAPAQAQKHVTINETFRHLDAIVNLHLKARNLSNPPSNPKEGNSYLIGDNPTHTCANEGGNLSSFQDGAWSFFVPPSSSTAWVEGEDMSIIFKGEHWAPLVAPIADIVSPNRYCTLRTFATQMSQVEHGLLIQNSPTLKFLAAKIITS